MKLEASANDLPSTSTGGRDIIDRNAVPKTRDHRNLFEAELSFHESLLYFRLPHHRDLGSEDPRFHPFDTDYV
jgi:hypothetical protein